METHEVKAKDCFVFWFPNEILACIVQFLLYSRVDFGSLALVNQDFRQLARSCQFRVVTFDGSHRCYDGILAHLMSEAVERQQNRRCHGQTRKPSLGACVRGVVINNGGGLGELKYIQSATIRRDRESQVVADIETYHGPHIHSVIQSLPNLKGLKLSGGTLSQSLLNSLVGSTVEIVTLATNTTALCPRMRPGVSWPITSLTLRLSASMESPGDHSLCWVNILRLCAPTLERLSMSHCFPDFRGHEHRRKPPLSFDLKFPNLYDLDIKWAKFLDPSALQSLILTSKKLHYLSIDCTAEEVRKVMHQSNGLISLRTLVANFEPRGKFFKGMTNMPLSFVKNLGDVTSFAFTRAASQELSEHIIAELRHFRELKKLLIVWDNACAQRPLLEALSTSVNNKSSLEELCLIIDVSDPWIPYSGCSLIQKILSPSFRGLRRLVVCCANTYFHRFSADSHPSGPNPYLQSAVAYAMAFPDLEVLRLWGHSIDIFRDKDGVHAEFSTKPFDLPFLGDFDTHDEHMMWL